jgi:tetratricopeptide (TPR) repeat protein
VTLVGGLAVSLAQWRRAERSAANARGAARKADVLRVRAEASAIEADQNFLQARQAVDKFYRRVFVEGILSQPGQESLRREMLAEILTYYRGFLKRRQDDPALRAELAETCLRIGAITSELGSKTDALAALHQAQAIYEAIARAEPHDGESRRQLARCHGQIGVMLANTGHVDEALRAYAAASDAWQDAVAADPSDKTARRALAANHGNIANLHYGRGEIDNARRAYMRALKPQEELFKADPASILLKRDVALTYHNIALTAQSAEQGIDWCYRALALREELIREERVPGVHRRDVARSLNRLADIETGLGWWTLAVGHGERAVALLEDVVRANPTNTRFVGDLAQACERLGYMRERLGRVDEAVHCVERMRDLLEGLVRVDGDDTMFRGELVDAWKILGRMHRDRGQPDQAIAAWRRAIEVKRPGPGDDPRREAERLSISGYIESAVGRRTRALAANRSALALREAVAHSKGAQGDDHLALGDARADLATTLVSLGQRDLARETLERAIVEQAAAANVDSGMHTVESRIALAALLRDLGCSREAAGAARAAVGTSRHPAQHVKLARELALAGAGTEALAVLDRAIGDGFRQPEALRGDAAFGSLRTCRVFEGSLMDAAVPLDPFAR